ncbi:MAG: hypothetical protein ACQERJ_10500 [Bacillota bacterium]
MKKQELRNLIDNGKEITVPRKEVTINGWTGTGYIVLNPKNGTAAYMISGGLSGGKWIDSEDVKTGAFYEVLSVPGYGLSTYDGVQSNWNNAKKYANNPEIDEYEYSILTSKDAAIFLMGLGIGRVALLVGGWA